MSSRIIPENNEGRIGMGFDASKVGRDPDAERLLRSSYSPSMNYEVRRLQEMLRSSGIDRMLASFQGSVARSMAPNLARSMTQSVTPNLAQSVAQSMAQSVAPNLARSMAQSVTGSVAASLARSMARSVTPNLAQSVARSVTPSMTRSIESLRSGLSRSIMQSFEAHELDSAHSAAWTLRRVQSLHTSPLRPFLKTAPTFGPIVVSPDYEDDEPFHYHPDLQGWLIPETATESGDAIDIEELIAEAYAYAVAIAQHHHTRALLTIVGKHGSAFVIRVAENVVGGLIVYWLLSR